MPVSPGQCYLPIVGPDEKIHLHVVLTRPNREGDVVVVSLTTYRPKSDPTVILNVGDHPFVRHQTAVNYRKAVATSAEILEERLAGGVYVIYPPVRSDVLRRIQEGIGKSDFTPTGIQKTWMEYDS